MRLTGRASSVAEQGMVLVAVTLLLMVVSALCGSLVLHGIVQAQMSGNHLAMVEALLAAEAGATHAVAAATGELSRWEERGHSSESAAVTALLAGPDGLSGRPELDADNGSLAALGLPPPGISMAAAGRADTRYAVRLLDDDDYHREVALAASDVARIAEDGDPFTDRNTTAVIVSVGYGSRNAQVTIEVTLSGVDDAGVLGWMVTGWRQQP